MTPESFNLRVRTKDKWSDHADYEKINTVNITFSFDCSDATMSTTAANTLTATQNLVVDADGSTTAISDTTQVDLSVAGCKGRNGIKTVVEIWHAGDFIIFKDENYLDPNSI